MPLFHESYTGDSRHTVMSAGFFVFFFSMHNVERPTVCRGQKGRDRRDEFCAPLGNGFCFFIFKYRSSHAFKGVGNLQKNVRFAPNIFFTYYSRSLCIWYNDFDRLLDLISIFGYYAIRRPFWFICHVGFFIRAWRTCRFSNVRWWHFGLLFPSTSFVTQIHGDYITLQK